MKEKKTNDAAALYYIRCAPDKWSLWGNGKKKR